MTTTIQDRPSPNHFFSVDRLPYRPKISPIEYIFREGSCELERRVERDWDINDLRHSIVDIFSNIGCDGKFRKIFIHCGYPY